MDGDPFAKAEDRIRLIGRLFSQQFNYIGETQMAQCMCDFASSGT